MTEHVPAHLDPAGVKATLEAFRDGLRAHKETINRLNVYPVPDGDTGTNMALTLDSVVTELDQLESFDMAAVCKAVSHGSLMGARGNSGVILSQILRGLSEVLREHEQADPGRLAAALTSASKLAYAAVMRPVEGTILTVVRETAEAAEAAVSEGTTGLVDMLEAARAGAVASLARTPEQLPVLAEAGVVDAGGAGFILLLDALLHVVDGRPLPQPQVGEGVVSPERAATHAPVRPHEPGEHDVSDLRYEVMYFLEAPDDVIPAFKDVWAGLGDSIVVVGGDGLWNCHIHTDDIGATIEAAIDCGRPRQIRVTDLLEQVEEERWVRDATAEAGADPGDEAPASSRKPVPTAAVAVATGPGIKRIFHSLGVHQIVSGGQSMNPSTAQLLEAVEECPADQVVILPNNKNIVAVAEQVDALTAKTVRVVPTHSITEGFAALLAYDPQASSDDNADEMAQAANNVVAGEVTQAVRDTKTDAGDIRTGDFIGVARSGIESVDATLAGACTGLLEHLVADAHEIVTIIEGEGASAAATRQITDWLAEHRPGVSAEVHHGGQPLYPYLFGVE